MDNVMKADLMLRIPCTGQDIFRASLHSSMVWKHAPGGRQMQDFALCFATSRRSRLSILFRSFVIYKSLNSLQPIFQLRSFYRLDQGPGHVGQTGRNLGI